jgi:putative SOS response-associated peptidase YedK
MDEESGRRRSGAKCKVDAFCGLPRGRQTDIMLIACLFSEWIDEKTGQTLLSFAAVTTVDPPQEVAAAGHGRMIIRLTLENVDYWLTPHRRLDAELQAILNEPQTAYYEHRVAA